MPDMDELLRQISARLVQIRQKVDEASRLGDRVPDQDAQ